MSDTKPLTTYIDFEKLIYADHNDIVKRELPRRLFTKVNVTEALAKVEDEISAIDAAVLAAVQEKMSQEMMHTMLSTPKGKNLGPVFSSLREMGALRLKEDLHGGKMHTLRKILADLWPRTADRLAVLTELIREDYAPEFKHAAYAGDLLALAVDRAREREKEAEEAMNAPHPWFTRRDVQREIYGIDLPSAGAPGAAVRGYIDAKGQVHVIEAVEIPPQPTPEYLADLKASQEQTRAAGLPVTYSVPIQMEYQGLHWCFHLCLDVRLSPSKTVWEDYPRHYLIRETQAPARHELWVRDAEAFDTFLVDVQSDDDEGRKIHAFLEEITRRRSDRSMAVMAGETPDDSQRIYGRVPWPGRAAAPAPTPPRIVTPEEIARETDVDFDAAFTPAPAIEKHACPHCNEPTSWEGLKCDVCRRYLRD